MVLIFFAHFFSIYCEDSISQQLMLLCVDGHFDLMWKLLLRVPGLDYFLRLLLCDIFGAHQCNYCSPFYG